MAEGRILEAHARVSPAAPDRSGARDRSGAEPASDRREAALHAGDLVDLRLSVLHDGQGRVAWPATDALSEALGPRLRVLDGPRVEPPRSAGLPGLPAGAGVRAEATWSAQVLAPPGEHELGGVPLQLTGQSSSEVLDEVEIPGPVVRVESVLEPETVRVLEAEDGAAAAPEQLLAELAPVRGPWSLRPELALAQQVGIGLGILLLLLLAAWLARRLLRRRPARRAEKPLEPAEIVAMRRLAELPRLLDEGRHLDFHVELADVVKSYLGRRYGLDLMECTTSEVRARLGTGTLGREPTLRRVLDDVLAVLSGCDLVKFARDVPPRRESLERLEKAERIVDVTTPVARDGMLGDTPERGAA